VRSTVSSAADPSGTKSWPPALHRRFEAIAFDWDGTAVVDRRADAAPVREQIEALCALGVDVGVTSGTHVENIDGQLAARPRGPGHLYLCVNRGSEVYEVGAAGYELVHRRDATPGEEASLDQAALGAAEALQALGLPSPPITPRFNRRKLDVLAVPGWEDPPKARIGELLDTVTAHLREHNIPSLAAVVGVVTNEARAAGLPDPRVTTDAKFVEIGLTDKSDSLHWLMQTWWRRGIGPGLVAIAGDEMGPLGGVRGSDHYMLVPEAARATAISVGVEPESVPPGVLHVGGGPAAFHAFLRDQTWRHEHHELSRIDVDPLWSVTIVGADPRLERMHQVLLSLAGGTVSSGGAPFLRHPTVTPAVFVGGAFCGEGEESDLLPCPTWQEMEAPLPDDADLTRILDLHTGVLWQQVNQGRRQVTALGFAALHRPGVVALAVDGLERHDSLGQAPLRPPPYEVARLWSGEGAAYEHVENGGVSVTASATERSFTSAARLRSDRVASYTRSAESKADNALIVADAADVDSLLRAHRAAWSARWEDSDIVVDGDDELQRSLRFSLYHLMSQVPDSGEAFVGARGLSGSAYRGHVFWDTDVFVLPFLSLTHPAAARAILEYRIRRLPAARARALSFGKAGARFPWESAAGGDDVTPAVMQDQAGQEMIIRTGVYEEHIVADVAWAACFYADWTGDSEFLRGLGADLVVETARYWASRCRRDAEGRVHIDAVIGPDEYHEIVDDNAFTNVMARWNLRRALQLHDDGNASIADDERQRWQSLVADMVDGYDPATQLYEQFAGFYALEPVIVAEVAPRRPVAADLLFGREYVARTQIIKQADVLMLQHMVPDEVAAGSLGPNLEYYEPRTAHGSSLSPGIHAGLLARAGRIDEAVELLRLIGRLDLDDITNTTAGGLHLAAMGSMWQALTFGFAGLGLTAEGISLDPHLPAHWNSLKFPIRVRGNPLTVTIRHDRAEVTALKPLTVDMSGAMTIGASAERAAVVRRDGKGRWEVAA
jgi:Glycosyl hydrolase family 65 central catalytic domain/Glycosyl hydrolase family 65, C-terminal domain